LAALRPARLITAAVPVLYVIALYAVYALGQG
jgi:hypothetical protein